MMKMIRRFINLLMDSDRDLRERQFLMLTTIIQIAVFIILIIDIVLGENIVEIVVLGISMGPFLSILLMWQIRQTRNRETAFRLQAW